MTLSCPFKIGDRVSMVQWDDTVPPWSRHGPGKITQILPRQNCQSGFMVTVKCDKGSVIELDSDWLEKLI